MNDFAAYHHYLDTCVNSLALVMNVALFYLIVRHSTFKHRVYKRLLLTSCVIDFLFSASVLFAQPVALLSSGCMVILSNGFLAGRSEIIDSLGLNVFVTLTDVALLNVAGQFIYRYRLLRHGKTSAGAARLTAFALVAWFILGMTVTSWYFFIPFDGAEVVSSNGWVAETGSIHSFGACAVSFLFVQSYPLTVKASSDMLS
ncbi:hypothetical protein AAVH_11285 [Aphelenchoides avenae]|nr:hypothetical protein AAVH_11285 [Aphelenchus avenae]